MTGTAEIGALWSVALAGPTDEARDHAFRALQARGGPEVLAHCLHYAESGTIPERAEAIGIISQLGLRPDLFAAERTEAVLRAFARETGPNGDTEVLVSCCLACAHLQPDPRLLDALLPLRRHASAEVRHAVAIALRAYSELAATEALIELSGDAADQVRDWAIFALGAKEETSTGAVVAALRARVDDPNEAVRIEAVDGLVTHRVSDAVDILAAALADGLWSAPLLDAAADLADPRLCAILRTATTDDLVFPVNGETLDLRPAWQTAAEACGCPPRKVPQ